MTDNLSHLILLNNPQELSGHGSKANDQGRRGAGIGKNESKKMIRLKAFL